MSDAVTATGGAGDQNPLRLGFVPGVMPGKWAARFRSRFGESALDLKEVGSGVEAIEALTGGKLTAALMPLPVDRDLFHAIPLYVEASVIVVPKSHDLAVFSRESLSLAELLPELVDEITFTPGDGVVQGLEFTQSGPETAAEAMDWVAAEVGMAVLPMPLARLHQRKGLVSVPVPDLPGRHIALVWPRDHPHALIEELAGIVRGRTANSSRTQIATPENSVAKNKGLKKSPNTSESTRKPKSQKHPKRGNRSR